MTNKLQELLRRFVNKITSHHWIEIWSIGIYTGDSPVHLAPFPGIANPVLTCHDVSDAPALYIADPFMLQVHGSWYMFFEVINRNSGRGEIGLAISKDGLHWRYQQIVLVEPFHLSYPYVFEWCGDYYMIPECYQSGSVRLYRADVFPVRWSLFATLLYGRYFVDVSVFQYDDKWWLFTETNPDFVHDTLRLYYADGLLGPWIEHPRSPVIQGNPHLARPAGRVLVIDGSVIRYAQDCFPAYGRRVRAFEVTELTTNRYREKLVGSNPILKGSGAGWNAWAMHHIDAHRTNDGRWIACVDGCGPTLTVPPSGIIWPQPKGQMEQRVGMSGW